MKRFIKICLVVILCAVCLYPVLRFAGATPILDLREFFGAYTGPANGIQQDDNVKASMDLLHVKAGVASGTSGDTWYVDSNETTGTENGMTWTTATDTLDEAVDLASAGDTILIADGHAENLTGADGVDVDVAGLTIKGLGNGERRPTFSFTNTASEFVIGGTGDNSSIENLRFIATVDSVIKAIDVEAACVGWSIIECEFKAETTTTDEFDDTIIIGAASDNGLIKDCRFLGDPGANAEPQSAINFVDCDNLRIIGNQFFGDRAVACIENASTASNNILIEGNILFNGIIGGQGGLNTLPTITLLATTTGTIINNQSFTNVAQPEDAIVGADMFQANNTYSEYENASGSVPVGKTYAVDALAALGIANTGTIFYCDSGETSGVEDGLTWSTATDTLDEAINLCTTDAGDVIFVAPKHTETFAAADGFDADVAGVTIIGIGRGEATPTFIFNDGAAEVAVGGTGDNVTIRNLRFECSVDSVLIGLDIEAGADGVTIQDCLFWEVGDATGTDEFDSAIRIGNACIDTQILNCKFRAEGAEAISAIHSDNDTSFTLIKGCTIVGDYASGCVNFISVASTDLHIIDNLLINGDLVGDNGINAVAAINCVEATGGIVAENRIVSDVTTGLLMRVADDMVFMDNWITDRDGDEFGAAIETTSATITVFVDGG